MKEPPSECGRLSFYAFAVAEQLIGGKSVKYLHGFPEVYYRLYGIAVCFANNSA